MKKKSTGREAHKPPRAESPGASTTSVTSSRESWQSSLLSLWDGRTAAFVRGVKALVLIFAAQAFAVWKNERPGSFYNWLALWNRWDAPHYLDIARTGYVKEGVESRWIVFYPLYPWLVRAFAFVFRDELVSAFFVSTIASLAAGLLLRRLAELDEEESVARASVFFMFIFP